MWLESLLLAVPLFVFALVLFRSTGGAEALQSVQDITNNTPNPTSDGWQAQLVFSIGAGIYEELLFRLIGIALLHMLLVDALALPHATGAIAAIVITSLGFAAYHFSSQNPFQLGKCFFYTVAGIYFAVVYLLRGFGIVAGTHALYDVMVVLL